MPRSIPVLGEAAHARDAEGVLREERRPHDGEEARLVREVRVVVADAAHGAVLAHVPHGEFPLRFRIRLGYFVI